MKSVRDTNRTAIILTPDTEADRAVLDAILHGEIKVVGCGRMADGTILHLTIGVPVEPEVGRQSCSEADEMRPGYDRALGTVIQSHANYAGHPPVLRTDARHYGTEKG